MIINNEKRKKKGERERVAEKGFLFLGDRTALVLVKTNPNAFPSLGKPFQKTNDVGFLMLSGVRGNASQQKEERKKEKKERKEKETRPALSRLFCPLASLSLSLSLFFLPLPFSFCFYFFSG